MIFPWVFHGFWISSFISMGFCDMTFPLLDLVNILSDFVHPEGCAKAGVCGKLTTAKLVWTLKLIYMREILSIGELWAVILCQNRVPLIPPWIVINFFIKINYLGVYTIFNHTQVVQVSNMSMAKSCWTPNFLVSENGIRFWTAATNFVCRQILHLIAPLFVFFNEVWENQLVNSSQAGPYIVDCGGKNGNFVWIEFPGKGRSINIATVEVEKAWTIN